MGIGVLLVFLVGASIIGYIHHHAPSTGNTFAVARNQSTSAKKMVRVNLYFPSYRAKYDSNQIHAITKGNKELHKTEDCVDASEWTSVDSAKKT